MKQLITIILLAASAFSLTAENIQLYFPHFAGQQYDFYIFEAERNDTLQRGIIPEDGRLTLNVPAANYRGMARWLLKNGGGLDFVLNGEDFSVSCTEAMPNDDNIIYTGSRENDFFREYFFRRQTVFQKTDALNMSMEAYNKEQDNPIYPLLVSEKEKQQEVFTALVKESIASSFYAARFRRISDFLNAYPLYAIYGNNEEGMQQYADDRIRFVKEELNMEDLYTSGLWRIKHRKPD